MVTKTKYFLDGNNVHAIQLNEDTTSDTLHPKIFVVKDSPMSGFYLSIFKDSLTVPEKIYGNTEARIDKCLQTYVERDASTGILLTGDKGSGKTLLTSVLANKIVALGIPVLIINEPYSGERFSNFISSLGEVAMIFDEFAKVYARGDGDEKIGDRSAATSRQESLLGLMDGIDKVKRLIILTENESHSINSYMLDRPSRLYYHFRYGKLDEQSITDFCNDKKVVKEAIEQIVEISRKTQTFSFDILQTIVEEHLRFGETDITEVVKDLNISLKNESQTSYLVKKVVRESDQADCAVLAEANTLSHIEDGVNLLLIKTPEVLAIGDNKEELEQFLDNSGQEYDYSSGSFRLYFRKRDMKYTVGLTSVYKSNGYVITVEKQTAAAANYEQYMAY